MSEARPKIFISAVSKELATARAKIADVLRLLHFEPVVQPEFPNHTGVVKAMLEEELAPCAAVIQIVGHRYGWEVYGAVNHTEVMSYTQYEAAYAHHKAIPIWYLIIADDYPVDAPNDEDEKKKVFQTAYRYRVQSTGHLYFPVADIKDVEIQVFRMQQSLDLLRPARFQQLPLLASGNGSVEAPPTPAIPSTLPAADLEKMLRGVLSDFVPALQQARQNTSPQDDAAAEDQLYARLAQILGKTPDEARAAIQDLARETKADPTEPLLERAKAAYALKDYHESERLALAAAAQAAAANPPDEATHLSALRQAGEAASEQIQYKRALDHYRAAAALTSEETGVLAWAAIQNEIGWLLYLDGQYNEQATLMHHVWQTCVRAAHPEHPTTLNSHHLWASALDDQGEYAAAAREYRDILEIRLRVLGRAHPETLSSRNNLATSLNAQGKYPEAEAEHRAVLVIQERILGPEHPHTLATRHNIALTLSSQGKHADAEAEIRAVLAIEEHILGREHPSFLTSWNNLASTLGCQGKYAEAEAELRDVLAISELVLGREHPDTLTSRNNLASTLGSQERFVEAEAELRDVLIIYERILGPKHPHVFQCCHNLSLTLANLGQKAEALDHARRALSGRNQMLGIDHPDSQQTKLLVESLGQ